MCMGRAAPNWTKLFGVATEQAGYFTTAQAAEAGYSSQLLHKYLANGRVARVRRGVYRVVHFPATEEEDLVVPWLWSGREGVFSHETALARHDLSDALPSRVHLTVPPHWRSRRVRVPTGVELHCRALAADDVTWSGSVPVTAPARTVNDCADALVQPGLVRQALEQGLARGLFPEAEVEPAIRWLDSLAGELT